MATISRQLLICLVIGFFNCGIHCDRIHLRRYPEPAKCESDKDCLKGRAKCIRRECHCVVYRGQIGNGKYCDSEWGGCNDASYCKNSLAYCIRKTIVRSFRTTTWQSCKCNPNTFGNYYSTGCLKSEKKSGDANPYPCLTDANCPPFSFCGEGNRCFCRDELIGDGESCRTPPPKNCSNKWECKHEQGKCVDGFCRCVGMYAGNGIYCRKSLSCPKNFKCPKYGLCIVDPLFPKTPFCMCDRGQKEDPKLAKCVDCLTNADCRQNNTICTAGNCTCADKAMHRDPPCTCKDGLVMSNGKCEPGPLHSCQADNDCDSRAKCIKEKCFCEEGSTGNGNYCRESNPCPPEKQLCYGNSKCVVDPLIPDNPHCVCSDGYRKTDDGVCVEITECFRKQGRGCPINQICDQVSDGSYGCTCVKGYEFITSGSVRTCQDTDECKDPKTCPANSVCENYNGSYECKCKNGYKKNDKDECQDVDECSESATRCGAGKCVNKQGGFSCKCEKGYVKKNRACGSPLRAGAAQVSGYINTFLIGTLGCLAFSIQMEPHLLLV